MNTPRPISRARDLALFVALLAAGIAALPSAAGAVTAAPAWRISLSSMPTNFGPGAHGTKSLGPRYNVRVTNVGEAAAMGPTVITGTVPAGLIVADASEEGCSGSGQSFTCTFTDPVRPGAAFERMVGVNVGALPDPTVLEPAEVTIESPGSVPQSAATQTTVSSEAAPFDFIADGNAGLGAWLTEADGSAAGAAGGHPSQLTVAVGVQSKPGMHSAASTTILPSGGGMRDTFTDLPPGLIVNPSATPARCTEAAYQANQCPEVSDIGRANVTLSLLGTSAISSDPLYNLAPPPGAAASFGFDPANTGLHVHVLGGLRPGDYAISAAVKDLPALFNFAPYGAQLQIWGDPSSASHDYVRGLQCSGFKLGGLENSCPIPKQDYAALSAPTSCTSSIHLDAAVDSWEAPGKFATRTIPFTDLEGNPAGISGCNAVPFKPTLSVQPTTNLADSPTGLDVDLAVPQSESLGTTATAHLKQATVTLPEGLVVNPSSANGLAGCSPAEIGIDKATGVADGNPAQCPDASKIGTVKVESPLLAEWNSEQKVKRDANGHVVPEPVEGSVYIATPHDNPFGSLLAIYLALENPEHGIIIKLAGKVTPDPQTGRLTTTFADNPQLPFSHFKLHFFDGARAALRTPLTCGEKTTTSTLTPWSAPEGADVVTSNSFTVTSTPAPGDCPQSEGSAATAPAFEAGTIAPQAGAYSPLVLKLSRSDGTQPLGSIDTTLPAGLTGKLAGIAYCPDGALAAAASKSGNAEKSSPSCPAASHVGSVDIGAGAGPTPYYTTGQAYLAGPYKGAPISLAVITPATAGPYDLGTVVVRAALNVDPETARIHAVSDPFPQVLEGIPLDVRSIVLRMDRPQFTLNPTSCDPMELTGSALSPFGSSAALKSPFQVGGCQALPFKPKLSLSLKGGTRRSAHPALTAVLTAKAGEAGIARTVVALPHSEFLEQGHIRTICTRVQFAASACPAGSIYGKAIAVTPLLDQPLTGPVYLRSSDHQLPDLVADLNGQIHIALVGRIDSVKGGIRTSFEAVPDAPVSKFVLRMQGGKKGLLVNSRNICKAEGKADVQMDGQNGKPFDTSPKLATSCKKGRRGGHRR